MVFKVVQLPKRAYEGKRKGGAWTVPFVAIASKTSI